MKQLQPSETLPVGLLLALAGGLLDGYSYLNLARSLPPRRPATSS